MLFKNIEVALEDGSTAKNMYVLTEGEFITYIGEAEPQNYSGEVYNGSGKIMLPGFYNTHCHAPMTLIRGYGEGLPLQRWLHEKMFPFEALLGDDDIYWGTLLAGMEMLASGVTSFTDMYFGMPAMLKAINESGLKCNLSHGCSDFSGTNGFKDINGYKGINYLLDYTKANKQTKIIPEASIHAEYTCTDRIAKEVADFAFANKLRLNIHLSETKSEHENCKQNRGGITPAQWFDKNGVFEVPVTAAHCVWVEDSDIDLLAKKDVSVSHCPSSNLKLGSGIAPLKKMLEKGVNVCFGTDGAASNNNLNMLEEITLASMLQKGAVQDPLFMGCAQTLTCATANGAKAQGRENCGAVKVGNRADIIVFDLDRPNTTPVFDSLASVFYSADCSNIVLNMIDGEVFYKNGDFLTIDKEKVLFNAKRIAGEKLAILENKN